MNEAPRMRIVLLSEGGPGVYVNLWILERMERRSMEGKKEPRRRAMRR